jgi:hypothetical protein
MGREWRERKECEKGEVRRSGKGGMMVVDAGDTGIELWVGEAFCLRESKDDRTVATSLCVLACRHGSKQISLSMYDVGSVL